MVDFSVTTSPVGKAVDTRWRHGRHGQETAYPGQLDPSAFTSGTHYNLNGATDNIIPSGVAITKLASGLYGPFVGSVVGEVQTVTISGVPTGGTFTLTFDGQTTSAIAYNASAATVQAALVALSNIGPSDVVVTGTGPYTLTFAGVLLGANVPAVTADGALLTGGTAPAVAIATSTAGSGRLDGFINDDEGVELGASPSTAKPTIAVLKHGIIKASRLPIAAQRSAVKVAPSTGSFIFVEA